jgi:hypothetical protein
VKVFLDDERPTPTGWHRVRWPDEAIMLLDSEEVTHISLDHERARLDRTGGGHPWLCPAHNHDSLGQSLGQAEDGGGGSDDSKAGGQELGRRPW